MHSFFSPNTTEDSFTFHTPSSPFTKTTFTRIPEEDGAMDTETVSVDEGSSDSALEADDKTGKY